MVAPFGFSVGDFLALGVLAMSVYRQCRDCPGEYRNLASETLQLTNTLRDLADVVRQRRLDSRKERELLEKAHGCKEVLDELNELLKKYNSLSTQSKRAWDRLSWDQQGARDIRARLTSNVVMLNAFYESLIHSSQIRIENALAQLLHDIQGGHKDAGSVVSLVTSSSAAGDEDEKDDHSHNAAWPQIIRDLEDLGISEAVANEHRSFIAGWIAEAIKEGKFSELSPEPEDEVADDGHAPLHRPLRATVTGLSVNSNATTSAGSFHAPLSPGFAARHVRSLSGGGDVDEGSMLSTARLIVYHWNRREWDAAQVYLERQISAVQRGETACLNGVICQPDVRVLQHLLGVCASYRGDLQLAKAMFQTVLRDPFADDGGGDGGGGNAPETDAGDIAAARWLGDTCLQLRQAEDAALAWAVAADLYIAQNEIMMWEPQPDILHELDYLDLLMAELKALPRALGTAGTTATAARSSPKPEADAPGIFPLSYETAKTRQLAAIWERMHTNRASRGVHGVEARPAIDTAVAEACLLMPPLTTTTTATATSPTATTTTTTTGGRSGEPWPVPYDPFFLPNDAVRAWARFQGLVPHRHAPFTVPDYEREYGRAGPLDPRRIPAAHFAHARAFAYTTRRDARWLIAALRARLGARGVAAVERESVLFGSFPLSHSCIAYHGSAYLQIRRMPLRSLCCVKLSTKLYRSRTPTTSPTNAERITEEQTRAAITAMIREILEEAEAMDTPATPP